MQGHAFDALVCIPNCDKIVPGMLLGRAPREHPHGVRVGRPDARRHPSGRVRALPPTSTRSSTARPQVMNGTMTEDELKYHEDTCVPHLRQLLGACSRRTRMNCLCEALGIALPGNGTIPAVYAERIRLAKHAGMKVMELLGAAASAARDIVSEAAIHNAMECDMAFGGSTNTVLHLTAIAREAGHPITMDDWDAASARTPHLVKLAPSGPRPLTDLYQVGGVPVVMARARPLGPASTAASLTCMGPLDGRTSTHGLH